MLLSVVGGAQKQKDESRMQHKKAATSSEIDRGIDSGIVVLRPPSGHNTTVAERLLMPDSLLISNQMLPVPAGAWAVGVSGGADSVALLLLLRDCPGVSLHVVHLDHQTRDGESGRDAAFVAQLAETLKLPCTIATRASVESGMSQLDKNTSTRYRLARFELFSQVIRQNQLQGVLLAHHGDDQAETVFMRILRGQGLENLGGMRRDTIVSGMRILRPLLNLRSESLRSFLIQRDQPWREDASNQSDLFQRNRVRHWLASRPQMREQLLGIESASRQLRDWLDAESPRLAETFAVTELSDLPAPIARHAAMRWLLERGAPPAQISQKICHRLIALCADAASPPRQHFPGKLLVCRRQEKVSVL
jgi:tRNA(Ile)-lysidine synthase